MTGPCALASAFDFCAEAAVEFVASTDFDFGVVASVDFGAASPPDFGFADCSAPFDSSNMLRMMEQISAQRMTLRTTARTIKKLASGITGRFAFDAPLKR